MSLSALKRAKDSLTIPDIWNSLGLPGNPIPGKKFRSPFREDRSPSFNVYEHNGDWFFKDLSTGESGDQIDLVAKALSCNKADAIRWFISQSGTRGHFHKMKPDDQKKSRPDIPPLDRGTYLEVLKLQELRKLPMTAGIQILINRGILAFCNVPDIGRCWLVTDSIGLNAQVRTLDGTLIYGKLKAKSLKGAHAGRAIGIQESQRFSDIWIVEGTPDLLAAATMAFMQGKAQNTGFVCITGAGNKIHDDDLPTFVGKHVTIFGHNDTNGAGKKAATGWARQMNTVAESVELLIPDEPGDLNDVVSRGEF